MFAEATNLVIRHGVEAVAALMAVDALLPAAGELTMLVAGAVAAGAVPGLQPVLFGTTLSAGAQSYVVLAVTGTLGYLAGALAGWAIGRRGGGVVLKRRTASVLRLDATAVARAEQWFARHGRWAVFLGRLTPLVRSFVSIVAGALGTPLGPYALLTLAGSAVWCFTMAGAGWIAGRSYERLGHAARYADVAIVLVAVSAAWAIRRRRDRGRGDRAAGPAPEAS